MVIELLASAADGRKARDRLGLIVGLLVGFATDAIATDAIVTAAGA